MVGQRYAAVADAAIILSVEMLFAALYGFLLMGDRLNAMGFGGCALIFVCILAVQMVPLMTPDKLSLTGMDEAPPDIIARCPHPRPL